MFGSTYTAHQVNETFDLTYKKDKKRNIAKVLSVMNIKPRTAYAVLKAISIMKRARDLHSIILVAMRVICVVRTSGL